MPDAPTPAAPPPADFATLFQAHRGIAAKVAGSYCRDPDDRADLIQEIAAQAWRAFPRYDRQRPFSTWLYRIALNVAIGDLRGRSRAHRQTLPLQDLDIADPHTADPERERQVQALYRFIAQLPALERALALLYLDDRPQREIAEILGIGESNVSTKIGRLKQRLRDEL